VEYIFAPIRLVSCEGFASAADSPSWIALHVNENTPEISACEAITVAAVERITKGMSAQPDARERTDSWPPIDPIAPARPAHVIQRKRRQYERIPGELDRKTAKVPKIGVERLPAGDRKETLPSTTMAAPRCANR